MTGAGAIEVSEDDLFEFERAAWSKRDLEDGDPNLDILCKRLELSEHAREIFAAELKDFVLHVILNIEWYRQALEKENERKRLLFLASVVLAALLPIVAGAVEHLFPDAFTYAMIAGLLSGMVAVQRMVSGWMRQRNVGEAYREASAKLKDLLYDIEGRWAGRLSLVTDETYDRNSEQFATDLESATRQARRILADERDRYFEVSAPAPVAVSLRSPRRRAGFQPMADAVGTAARFQFHNSFSEAEVDRVLKNHDLARSTILACEALSAGEKAELEQVYGTGRIWHYQISGSDWLGTVGSSGNSIGLNMDLFADLPDRELAQTLIHEMMHCCGYTHPELTDDDRPNDNGPYYGSAPLRAELCIAGRQAADGGGVRTASLETCVDWDSCKVRAA